MRRALVLLLALVSCAPPEGSTQMTAAAWSPSSAAIRAVLARLPGSPFGSAAPVGPDVSVTGDITADQFFSTNPASTTVPSYGLKDNASVIWSPTGTGSGNYIKCNSSSAICTTSASYFGFSGGSPTVYYNGFYADSANGRVNIIQQQSQIDTSIACNATAGGQCLIGGTTIADGTAGVVSTVLFNWGTGLVVGAGNSSGNGSVTVSKLKLNGDGMLTTAGRSVNTVQAVTVADDGAGTAATNTLTPSSSYVSYTCSDANGCTITVSETGAVDGSLVRIVNASANTCNFADTSGVTELTGAFAMGQWDTLTLLYATDRWVEIARSNN
jgi:hypothetical protein